MDSLNLGELLNVRGRGSDNNRNAILNRLGAHLPVTGGGSSSSQQVRYVLWEYTHFL